MAKLLERELNPQHRYTAAHTLMQDVTKGDLDLWKSSPVTRALLLRLEGDLLNILQGQMGGAISQESCDGTAQLYAHTIGQLEALENIANAITGMEIVHEA